MLFGLKNRPFVKANILPLAPEANVAAIGRPKTAYPDVENIHKNNSSRRI